MSIQMRTLYEAVKDKKEYEIKLLAGEKGLDNTVSWVHVVERKELSTFLEGQEITFITGIALKSKEELIDLVRLNFENNASAIIINVGPFIPQIPQEVIEFCNQNDFPVFEVPWHIYMANIMKKFSELITFSDRTQMELSAAAQNAIFFPVQEELYIPTFEKNDFNKEWPYCVVIFDIQERETDNAAKARDYFKRRLEWILTQRYKKALAFEIKEQFVVLFANQENEELQNCAEKIVQDFYVYCKGKGEVYCGIGRNTKSIKCLCKSYALAEKVLRLQKKRGLAGQVAAYKNLGTYKLLIGMDDNEIIKEFYEETILPLVEYDRDTGSEYIKFLKIYFEEGGNIQKTAARLFVHRNSVNYKISRIEEILNCDLSNLEEKIEINLALKLTEIM